MTVTDPGTRIYLWSDRKANAVLRSMRGLFEGFWLGVLDEARMARIDEAYYSNERIYDSESYNRGGLSGWEADAVEKHFSSVRRVIVTSAGGGREVLALTEAGYAATGYEPHRDLVRFGRTLTSSGGDPIPIHESERDGWPSAATSADAVIVGWGGYMLIGSSRRRVDFLRAAADALPIGGPILLSFFYRHGSPRGLRITAYVANVLRRVLRRPLVDVGDALVPNRVHYFSHDEVAHELAEAGFETVDFGSDEYGWAVGRKVSTGR